MSSRKIGGTPVDDQGMVRTPGGPARGLHVHGAEDAHDGKMPLTLVRAGKEMTVDLPVASRRPMLVPEADGAYPSYFVYGPMVFSDGCGEFSWWAGRFAQRQLHEHARRTSAARW